jgi:hypothetical protein
MLAMIDTDFEMAGQHLNRHGVKEAEMEIKDQKEGDEVMDNI